MRKGVSRLSSMPSLGNRAGTSPAHQCSQCTDAVPLLEDGQLHIVPSEPARLGRQGHQETGAGDTVQLSRKERIFSQELGLYVPIRTLIPIGCITEFHRNRYEIDYPKCIENHERNPKPEQCAIYARTSCANSILRQQGSCNCARTSCTNSGCSPDSSRRLPDAD